MKNLWTCPKCGRIFEKKNQVHSCRRYPLEKHFKGKEDVAKPLFNDLKAKIKRSIGPIKVISLPCCIHFFGLFDFAAVFPLKDKIRIHFALDHKLKSSRVDKSSKYSASRFMHSIDIESKKRIDKELIGWLKEAYHLRTKK
jgi:hypothetical protein